jgi:hypothetical protein
MGKRPAESDAFWGNMRATQWEETVFYAKRRATSHGHGTCTHSSETSGGAKAPVYLFGSSPHPGTGWKNRGQIPSDSAPGRVRQ